MKIKRIIVLTIGAFLILTSTGKPFSVATQIQEVKEYFTQKVLRVANTLNTSIDTKEPSEVFSIALEGYKEEFPNYINITGLNVSLKEEINLPGFDINYIPPTFADVMYKYQKNLESNLSDTQLNNYELLRQRDYDFDVYVTLNENRYVNPKLPPKYSHGPTINTLAVVTTSLVAILSGAGLTEAAISAFTGAVSSISAAVSTSWIPVIGWVLAVSLVVGALIAITVIIVQYWEEICSVIDQIKAWFLEQFQQFADLINYYFADAVAQGEESTVAERQVINGRELVWRDAHMTKDAVIAIATELRRDKNKVILMKNQTFPRQNEMSWWIPDGYVDEEFVVQNRLYEAPYYFSTYTWYNSTAKRMLHDGAPNYSSYGGYGYKNLIYHTFTGMKRAIYGWNHYHMGKYNPLTDKVDTYDEKEDFIHNVHCFFGLTYIRLPDNQGFESYPARP